MSYFRQLKIYYTFGIKPSDNNKFDELIEFIEDIFKNIKKYIIKNKNSVHYNDYLYKNDKNINIFLHDLKTNIFYINYRLIWLVFENKFDCNYTEIQQIMKYVLFKTYKLREITPKGMLYIIDLTLFKTYKLKEIILNI